MTMTFRDIKGSNLTADEVDANFRDVIAQIAAVTTTAGVGVSNITVTGTQMTVFLSDATTLGPFTLPVARLRFNGTWTAGDTYFENDLLRVPNVGLVLVLQDHVADTTFDINASNTDGLLYKLALPRANFVESEEVATNTYVLQSTDVNKYLRFTHASGCHITVPSGLFNPDSEVHFCQRSVGSLSWSGDTGVVFNPVAGFDDATDREGAVVTLKHISDDEYDKMGLLAEVTA